MKTNLRITADSSRPGSTAIHIDSIKPNFFEGDYLKKSVNKNSHGFQTENYSNLPATIPGPNFTRE